MRTLITVVASCGLMLSITSVAAAEMPMDKVRTAMEQAAQRNQSMSPMTRVAGDLVRSLAQSSSAASNSDPSVENEVVGNRLTADPFASPSPFVSNAVGPRRLSPTATQ